MPSRTPIEQTFSMGGGASLVGGGVTNVAQSIAPSLDINNLIVAFIICNPSANANSVWWGDQSVTISNGIEIPPGSAQLFTVDETRQMYEIQNSLITIYEKVACSAFPNPDFIPVVVWNPNHIFIVASVAGPITNIGMLFFKNVYL